MSQEGSKKLTGNVSSQYQQTLEFDIHRHSRNDILMQVSDRRLDLFEDSCRITEIPKLISVICTGLNK